MQLACISSLTMCHLANEKLMFKPCNFKDELFGYDIFEVEKATNKLNG